MEKLTTEELYQLLSHRQIEELCHAEDNLIQERWIKLLNEKEHYVNTYEVLKAIGQKHNEDPEWFWHTHSMDLTCALDLLGANPARMMLQEASSPEWTTTNELLKAIGIRKISEWIINNYKLEDIVSPFDVGNEGWERKDFAKLASCDCENCQVDGGMGYLCLKAEY